MIVRGVLENLDLTLLQSSTLDDISGGTFNPKDKVMYKSVIEILELASAEKVDTLLSQLKKLPSISNVGDTKTIFFLDGKECSYTVFMDKDGDFMKGRWDGTHPAPKRTRQTTRDNMSEDEFKQIQEDFKERWANIDILDQPRVFDVPPKDEEPSEPPKMYRDIGDEDRLGSISEEDEMYHDEEYVEPANRHVTRGLAGTPVDDNGVQRFPECDQDWIDNFIGERDV